MKKLNYIPELDGIRAIAIVLVLLTHANFQLARFGYLGVQVFFSLSGFLITSILLLEKSNHELSLKGFYIRRAFRLLPALFVFLLFIQLYNWIFEEGQRLEAIQGEIIASLFYVYNLSWLWNEGILITHMWSLAVEEQFYLIWPLIFVLLGGLRLFPWALFGFILVSILFKIFIGSDVWYSLAQESLFMGCLAAIINQNIKIQIPNWLNSMIFTSLIILGVFLTNISTSFERLLPWMVGFIACIPIISFTNGEKNQLLSNSIIVYLGKLSYSLYLWHVPIFKWFQWYSTIEPWQGFMLKFIVTFFISATSYHFIEKPMIKFGRKLLKNQIRSKLK
jgi:peptidoglycan/LPS O-acetylase OafA/YrhL